MSFVGRVLIREMGPQVAGPHRAQEGVADGVGQDVGIGMAQQPQGMRDFHPSQDQGAPCHQPVGVIPQADSHVFSSAAWKRWPRPAAGLPGW